MKKLLLFLLIFSAGIITSACKQEMDPYENNATSERKKPKLSKAKVQVAQVDGKWRLYRDKEPYYVRGAAASASTYPANRPDYYYGMLADFGGNTIRTYSANEYSKEILDAAHAHGIAVCFGLWMQRETDGFDYDDEAAVAQQLENLRQQVLEFKDHPALLMWGIGNEADAAYTNLKLWNAVNDIAEMIHEEDPDHPTTTMLSNSAQAKIAAIKERAPALDILSVNTYAPNLPGVLGNLQEAGWEKPYMITEFGPRGTWQMNPEPERILPWGALVEQTSTEKAGDYLSSYQDHIISNVDNGCLGSFAFTWGYQTHGAVLTWYGFHNTEGRSFGAADAMQLGWTGGYPSNRAPVIASREDILLNGLEAEDAVVVAVGSTNQASVTASDPDGDPLEYEWVIAPEGTGGPDGGPHPGLEGWIQTQDGNDVVFTAVSSGEYRLYVYVKDDHNKVASAVVPFLVE